LVGLLQLLVQYLTRLAKKYIICYLNARTRMIIGSATSFGSMYQEEYINFVVRGGLLAGWVVTVVSPYLTQLLYNARIFYVMSRPRRDFGSSRFGLVGDL
jgi:hypothetical protein